MLRARRRTHCWLNGWPLECWTQRGGEGQGASGDCDFGLDVVASGSGLRLCVTLCVIMCDAVCVYGDAVGNGGTE